MAIIRKEKCFGVNMCNSQKQHTAQAVINQKLLNNINNSNITIVDVHTAHLNLHEKFEAHQTNVNMFMIAIIVIMVLIVFAAICYGLYVLYKKRINTTIESRVQSALRSMRRRQNDANVNAN